MSGVFMDGGGGDSLSHGGDGIDHGGHDHGSHGIQHGHGQAGHNFLAQVLGLDQHDHAHLAHHGGEGAEGLAPSQSPSWNSALQGLKLENLIAGINITPNFLLFMLFASFVGWLGVIYWIRHHEPFANQVLGSSAAFAPTVGADRQLINDCRDALPFKTSAQSGIVYVPEPGQNNSVPPAGSPVNAALSAAFSSSSGQATPASAATGQTYAPSQFAATQPVAGKTAANTPQANSPVNQDLSSAMSAALGQSASPPVLGQSASPAQAASAQSFASTQPNSNVNQGLSAAMSSALGPASGASSPAMAAPSMPGPAASYQPASAGAAYAPGYPGAAPSNFMPPMSQSAPMAAGPHMPGEGGMRLFSSRRSMMAQSLPQAPSLSQTQPSAMLLPGRQAGLSNTAVAPAPLANANTWSLANQGSGTFSADTAQFNSQFGAPLDAAGSAASMTPDPASPGGASAGLEGQRQKVLTEK